MSKGPINERVATLEAMFAELNRRVTGQGLTLYGTQGNGGLQADVAQTLTTLEHHIKDSAEDSERKTTILVGENGDGGMVRDIASIKADLRRAGFLAKALFGIVVALTIEAGRRIITYLAHR